MKIGRLIRIPKPLGAFRAGLLLLCAFFLMGLLLGRAAHSAITPQDDQRLYEYIVRYAQLSVQPSDMIASLSSVLAVYLRYPLLAFLLGFAAVGVVLIPSLCLIQGFFLSFSVSCFVSALGRSGIILALSAFGVRCLFTLPCTLFLAAWSFKMAVQLLQRWRTGHKRDRALYDSAYFLRFLVCLLVLLLGVAAELSLVPKLMQMALSDII